MGNGLKFSELTKNTENDLTQKVNNECILSFQEMVESFHNHEVFLSEKLFMQFPSQVRVAMLPNVLSEAGAIRRALACAIAAMKANGSHGLHVEVPLGDKAAQEKYTKLGFFDVATSLEQLPEHTQILGRTI